LSVRCSLLLPRLVLVGFLVVLVIAVIGAADRLKRRRAERRRRNRAALRLYKAVERVDAEVERVAEEERAMEGLTGVVPVIRAEDSPTRRVA
jgi:hypothetical protein